RAATRGARSSLLARPRRSPRRSAATPAPSSSRSSPKPAAQGRTRRKRRSRKPYDGSDSAWGRTSTTAILLLGLARRIDRRSGLRSRERGKFLGVVLSCYASLTIDRG